MGWTRGSGIVRSGRSICEDMVMIKGRVSRGSEVRGVPSHACILMVEQWLREPECSVTYKLYRKVPPRCCLSLGSSTRWSQLGNHITENLPAAMRSYNHARSDLRRIRFVTHSIVLPVEDLTSENSRTPTEINTTTHGGASCVLRGEDLPHGSSQAGQ